MVHVVARDAIGILLVTPFLVLLLRSSPQGWNAFELVELAALLLGLIFVCLVVFGPLSLSLNMQKLVTAWLCFPFLIWAAFRFRPIEATGATLILFGSATWGTVQGYGTFADKSLTKSLLLLDPFIAVVGTMTLVVAAMVAERKSAEQELLTAQRLLQTAVEEKERDLVVTVKALEMEADGHVQTRTALHLIQEKSGELPRTRKQKKETEFPETDAPASENQFTPNSSRVLNRTDMPFDVSNDGFCANLWIGSASAN